MYATPQNNVTMEQYPMTGIHRLAGHVEKSPNKTGVGKMVNNE